MRRAATLLCFPHFQNFVSSVRVAVFAILLLRTVQTFAQPDTAFVSASIARASRMYQAAYKSTWPVNSGGQYVEYASIEGEHPYFISTWSLGSVVYQGDVYDSMSLLLDLRGDRLIVQHALFDVRIELSPPKVTAFTMAGHAYIHIRHDTVTQLPGSGYYEVLQRGAVSLIARHQKTIQRSMTQGKVIAIMKHVNRYYLLKGGIAIPVSSRKSILDALKDRPELKSLIKRNKIRFGLNREAALSETVRIYNETFSMP